MSGEPVKRPKSVKERWLPLLGERASFGVLRRDGIIVYESDAILETLGWRPEEVTGQRGRILLHPDSIDDAWKLANAAWDGTSGVTDLRYLHKDGSVRWMQLHATRLDDEHLLLYRRDVTPRRDAERALHRSNQLLEAVAAIQAEYIESPSVLPFSRLLDAFVTCTDSKEGVFALLDEPRSKKPQLRIVAQTKGATQTLARVESLRQHAFGDGSIELLGELAHVPLRGSDSTLLAVVILGGRTHGYDAAVVEPCRPLELTAVRLLESDRDRRRHVEAEQELELLKTLAFAIAEAKDLDSALAVSVRTFVERTGWEFGQAWIPTMDRLRLEPTSAWFASDARFGAFRDVSRTIQYGPGEGMVGRVWMTKRPWWVDATEAESRGFPRVVAAAKLGLVVSFCVPIVADGEVVALLEFFSTRSRPEDQRTLSVVAACAAQVASILERKRAERGFEVLATALKHMGDAATVITQRGDTLVLEYANPAYKRLTGFDPADIVGRDPTFLYGPATDGSVIERLTKEGEAGRSARIEIFLYDKEGRARELELSNTPVPNADGTETTHVTVWRELGAAPESSGRERDIAWRQTFDSIRLPMVIVAPSHKVEAVNLAAAEIIGKPRDEIVGRRLSEIGVGEPWLTAQDHVAEVLKTGRARELQIPDPALGRSWQIVLNALVEQQGVIMIARDIARLGHVRPSQDRVEMLAVLGRLIGGIAHEVRNPLFGIGATLDALEARLGERQEFSSYVRVFRGELTRLAELTNDLLAYGRPPRLVRDSHSLPELVAEAVARSAVAAKQAGITVRCEPSIPVAMVRVDRGRIVFALMFLLDTAIQRSKADGAVRVRAVVEHGAARIEIEDRGPPHPPGDLPRLFEPFFFRRPGGTGLGLAIVQRVVERHDGMVSVREGAEGGVVVLVTLPIEVPTEVENGR